MRTGTLVARARRTGRVITLDKTGRKALVMWSGSWVAAWSKVSALRVVF